MRLGLLQCGVVRDSLIARHGDYSRLYAELLGPGFAWQNFRCFAGEVPDDPDLCDGWLVSGSRFGAYEPHDWIPPLEDLLRRIHGRRPLVGICFGHQIVSQALGGRVEKSGDGWVVGRSAYDWEGEILHLNAWHQDRVTAPPPGATAIAASDGARYAGFRIGETTLTLQPHPEFGPDFIADMIPEVGRGTVPDPLLDAAAARLARPVDNARVGRRIAAFLRERAGQDGGVAPPE